MTASAPRTIGPPGPCGASRNLDYRDSWRGVRGAVRWLSTVCRDCALGRIRLRLVRVCSAGPCREDVAADTGGNAPSRLLNPTTRSPSQATEGGRSRLTSFRLCPDSADWTAPEQHWRRVRVVLRPVSLGRNLWPDRLESPAGDLSSGGSKLLVDNRIVRWPALRVGDRPCRSLGVPLLVAGHHLGALDVSSSVQGQNSIVWISPEVIGTSFSPTLTHWWSASSRMSARFTCHARPDRR